ncbi:NGFI-A-binding protein 1-like isoform X5 [Pomacea canaliculata]|uniref:NGFI-A-binding protein 1-like isoform X5 n=1 Tax=Pomacea canaliculata TaxID=400727 RepID=UPI000D72992B|nr:NGFI-A-binding protein 1-like isoform X5 [Pomacea canaliculata]
MDPQLSPDVSIVEVRAASCAFACAAASATTAAAAAACPQVSTAFAAHPQSLSPSHGGRTVQSPGQERYLPTNHGHQTHHHHHQQQQHQQQISPPQQLHLALGSSRGVDVACWIQNSAAAQPTVATTDTSTHPTPAAHPLPTSSSGTTRLCQQQQTSSAVPQQQQHVWHLQPHQQVHNHQLASAPLSHRPRGDEPPRHCSAGEGPPKFPHPAPFPPHGANNGFYPSGECSWGTRTSSLSANHVTAPNVGGREGGVRGYPPSSMPVLLEGARWTVGSEQQSPPSLPQPSFGGQVIGPASVRSEPPQGSGAGPGFGKGGVIGGSSSLATNTGFNQGSNPVKGQYPCVGQMGSGGAVAMTTSQPSNASEWQLYNVLKRANLLQYYDTFIAQGGDDVQQLCEAGEDEFLEIMALVGMAAKPLHVRRLQKALQEWVANPAALEANASAGYPVVPLTGPAPGSISAVVRDCVNLQTHPPQTSQAIVSATTWTPQPPPPPRSISPSESIPSPSSVSIGPDGKEDRGSSPMLQPVLIESQIKAIAMAASSLAKQLPYFEPKDLNAKKPINREIQNLMTSQDDHPNRIEELRKYAAIYGRFDSKRKNDRPMSLHEISVNEAAAQLCLHCPALLTRREDLFPLARQVVRDSGYQYSKGHSRAADVVVSTKKARLDPVFQRHLDASFGCKQVKQEFDKDSREERMSAVAQELASIRQHKEQVQAELATAREEEDFFQTQKLKSELDSLTSQQLQVLQEHSDLLRQPHSRHSRSNFSKQSEGGDQNKGKLMFAGEVPGT